MEVMTKDVETRLAEMQTAIGKLREWSYGGVSSSDVRWLLSLVRELQAENESLKHSSDSTHKAASENYARASAAEAREKELLEALAEVVDWDSESAAAHGRIGVREFARAALTKARGEE